MMEERPTASPRAESRWWWLPLALIAAALVLILAVPLVTSTQLQRLRRHEGNVSAPALVWVNDLEAAVGAETAARSEASERTTDYTDARSTAMSARAIASKDLRILDSLVRDVGPGAIALLADAKVAIESWQQEEDLFTSADTAGALLHGAGGSAIRSPRWRAVELALSKVQRLDDTLAFRSQLELNEIAHLEHFNGVVPIALVPFALLALAAVGWTARRTRKLSREASEGRTAAEQALTAKSALMRGVTHDLKNPLGAARGYIDLLADGALGPVPETQVKAITRLRSLINVTLDTVRDLLELSKAESRTLSVDLQPTDIAVLARDVVDDFRATAKSAGVSIEVDITSDIEGSPIVTTDPQRVRQVLGNLLSNAVKYTPTGRVARVGVSRSADASLGRAIAIDVADNGRGIPPHLRERVFEEFFRVPDSSNSAQGSGVGLAIARRVARLLGGDLRLRATDGGGATFVLLLPDVA
jgi:signal transduction histidine kinase